MCQTWRNFLYKSCCNNFLDERKLYRTKYQYKIPPETGANYTQGKGDKIRPTKPIQRTYNKFYTYQGKYNPKNKPSKAATRNSTNKKSILHSAENLQNRVV
jgi:hypothetical protein